MDLPFDIPNNLYRNKCIMRNLSVVVQTLVFVSVTCQYFHDLA